MRKVFEAGGWVLVLFGAGLGVIGVGRATAPAYTDGDVADSKLFYLLTFALAALAMAAGYRIPRMAWVFGLVAVVPYFAYVFGIGYPMTGEQRSFMWVGFFFLLPFAAIPIVGAVVGSVIRGQRQRRTVSAPKTPA